MYFTFQRIEDTTLNLDPDDFADCRDIDEIAEAIRRELGPGVWEDWDLFTAAEEIHSRLTGKAKEPGAPAT